MTRTFTLASVVLALAASSGCSAVLGVEDIVFTDASADAPHRTSAEGGSRETGGGHGSDSGGSDDTGPPPSADAGSLMLAQPAASSPFVTSGSTATLSLTNPVGAGDLLVVALYWTYGILQSSPATLSVTDSLGNTWEAATMVYDNYNAPNTSPACKADSQIYFAAGVKGGSDTVTVTTDQSDNTLFGFTVLEYAGAAMSHPVDGTSGTETPEASNLEDAGDIATTGARDVIVAAFVDTVGSGTMSPGAGYAVRGVASSLYAMVEDDSATGVGPGAHSVTATLPTGVSNGCWSAAAAAFRVP